MLMMLKGFKMYITTFLSTNHIEIGIKWIEVGVDTLSFAVIPAELRIKGSLEVGD